MEHTEYENYTCPYCKWSHSHSWSNTRVEADTISREYLGADIEKTYWLEKKKKFKVRICSKCEKNLKIRSNIITFLLMLSLVCGFVGIVGYVANRLFQSPIVEDIAIYTFGIGLALSFVLFIFYLLWKIFGPSRAHVNFERSKKCNALAPLETTDLINNFDFLK